MTDTLSTGLIICRTFAEHPPGSLLFLTANADRRGPSCLALKVSGSGRGGGRVGDAALVIRGSPYDETDLLIGELLTPNDLPVLQRSMLGIPNVGVEVAPAGSLDTSFHGSRFARAAIGFSDQGAFIVGGVGHGVQAYTATFSVTDWTPLQARHLQVLAWASEWAVVIAAAGRERVSIPIHGYSPLRYQEHPARPR